MTKEMLFLADIYTNWCKSQGLPDYMSADDLRYGRDTTDKLNFYQMNWLECFIDVWDCINQNTQEVIMTEAESLEWDANTVMEQIHMAESRHMQMGALCSYLLQYPDMTIRDFFAMASEEIREEEEELGYYE